MQRFEFSDLFRQSPDGSITPRRSIKIGGVTIGPGITFRPGVLFSGVDIFQLQGRTLAVEESAGMLEIKGFYE